MQRMQRQFMWSVTSNQPVICLSRLRAELGVIHPATVFQQLVSDLNLTTVPADAGPESFSLRLFIFLGPSTDTGCCTVHSGGKSMNSLVPRQTKRGDRPCTLAPWRAAVAHSSSAVHTTAILTGKKRKGVRRDTWQS